MNFKNVFQTIIGILVVGGIGWGIYELFSLLLKYISLLDNDLASAIIAGFITIVISVITVVLGKYYERKLTIEKSLREKKIPAYQELVKFFFEFLYEKEKTGKKFTDQELVNRFSQITQGLMIWGSDEVVKAWSKFRQTAADANDEEVDVSFETMILLENLLKEIRSDIGYKGTNLEEGELLGLFINDIKKELKKSKK